jgi:hypothetical protein
MHSTPILNDTVDLHFKQSTITEILPVPKSNSVLSMSPESGQSEFWRPYSDHLARMAGFRRFWQIPASMSDYAEVRPFCAGIQQFWPEFDNFPPESGKPKFRRNCSNSGIYLEF